MARLLLIYIAVQEMNMSKQTITVDGEERVVREDTAKAFRGVHWALLSVAAFILIALLLLLTGVISMGTSDGVDPAPVTDRGPGVTAN